MHDNDNGKPVLTLIAGGRVTADEGLPASIDAAEYYAGRMA